MTKLITSAHTAIFQWVTTCASSLPTGEPEAQPERVQDHEEHPEPVDQDASDWTELA